MAESSFATAHARMLKYEGGYSNHPSDPGGVTLEGVTQATYDSYRRDKGLPQQNLTPEMRGRASWIAERNQIYRTRYWRPSGCPQLEPGVDAAIYDYAVNSGVGRASKVLQRLVGVADDGKVGPVTIAAANRREAKALAMTICNERVTFLKGLSTYSIFGRGWLARVADVKQYSTAMAQDLPPPAPKSIIEPVGKGEVPEPKALKNVIKGGVPTAAAATGASFWQWVAEHQTETVLIAIGVVIVIGLALHGLNRRRQWKQEAPTPGFGVVPENNRRR